MRKISLARRFWFQLKGNGQMFLSGVRIRSRLDSRLKHAGMTEFGLAIRLTQQAVRHEPLAIQIMGIHAGNITIPKNPLA